MRWRHRLYAVSVKGVVVDQAVLTGTVVVGVKHGKEGANGEDIVVLCELGHRAGCSLQAAGKLSEGKEWWSALELSWDADAVGACETIYMCILACG